MPIGYLVGVTLVVWWTSFALAPLRWPRGLAAISFRFGVVLNELPFVALYLLLASTLLATARVMSTRRAVGRCSLWPS